MATLLYHTGTGTYFSLDDNVIAIDTDTTPNDALQDLYDSDDDRVTEWGSPVIAALTANGPVYPTGHNTSDDPSWVIVETEPATGLYWSNDNGWADLTSATRFTTAERHTVALPLGGRWLHMETLTL